MRLGDLDALEQFIKTARQALYLDKTLTDIPTRDNMLLNFEQYIHLQPTIEAQPVVHGFVKCIMKSTFEQYEPSVYACSVCSKHISKRSNYCPNCGAKMDEKEKTD